MKKQVLVSADEEETRVALLETDAVTNGSRSKGSKNGKSEYKVAELYIERRSDRSIVGNIYKGKVANVLPGLEAAFVDIGLDKNGFLHVDEIVLPGVETVRRGQGGRGRRINDLLKVGQEIVVQVVKDPLKTKGARLSMELTIAGRYMVYMPTGEGIGVSRRLEDRERERLRKEIAKMKLRSGGVIIRTAAHGAKLDDFERELIYLEKLNEVLQQRVDKSSAPALVFQEADLPIRVVRDISSGQFERAVVDNKLQHERLSSFFSRTAPDLVERVEFHEGPDRLFASTGIDQAIESTLSHRVDLPSGGYLVIDYTEALTVVDINTGSFTGKGKTASLEDTIAQTNLEAAEEVVRQLRLRDIGGIIVIDFIDMAKARNRDTVLKTLRKALERDRTKTYVVEISPLGLVEMTRQNVTDGVREIITKPCPTCHGEGVVRSEETMAIEIKRRLRELAATKPDCEAFLVQINSRVRNQFVSGGGRMLTELEADTGKIFHFDAAEGFPLEHFDLMAEGSKAEIEKNSLPFSVGDEVLVEISEPHMYRENDAVAKLDGYIITVIGAVSLIGQTRLVRIEEVDRIECVASLVAGVSTENAGDDVQSTALPNS